MESTREVAKLPLPSINGVSEALARSGELVSDSKATVSAILSGSDGLVSDEAKPTYQEAQNVKEWDTTALEGVKVLKSDLAKSVSFRKELLRPYEDVKKAFTTLEGEVSSVVDRLTARRGWANTIVSRYNANQELERQERERAILREESRLVGIKTMISTVVSNYYTGLLNDGGKAAIEGLDVTNAISTVYTFVKNSGLLLSESDEVMARDEVIERLGLGYDAALASADAEDATILTNCMADSIADSAAMMDNAVIEAARQSPTAIVSKASVRKATKCRLLNFQGLAEVAGVYARNLQGLAEVAAGTDQAVVMPDNIEVVTVKQMLAVCAQLHESGAVTIDSGNVEYYETETVINR